MDWKDRTTDSAIMADSDPIFFINIKSTGKKFTSFCLALIFYIEEM